MNNSLKSRIKRAIRYILRGTPVQNIKAEIAIKKSGELLKGRNVVITGGGRGLGFYIAKRCIEEGANVLITGRSRETLQRAASELGNCHYLAFDVTNLAETANFFDECEALLGGTVDCLVNNAGVSHHEYSFFTITEKDWDVQFDTNLKAPFFLSQEYCKRFIEAGKEKGSILFVSSERSFFCDERPYGLIKVAINSLSGGLARRFLDKGIRINAIAPGVTASDMTGFDKNGNLYYENSCGHRVFMPEEVAETAIYLLSDLSACVSGHVIPTNNGNHLKCDW